ncbi:MAG TPA: glycoside hydrolase family 38 C-terminal domain-containing protein [Candidatus Latescibacteria bacterium]|nr:glycoside hydrolase family 38 C-terminal domain-containing protein [Candidatus Latescibacterota bacterium]
MPHFPAERTILVRQIGNRLNELFAALYRNRTPITGWQTYVAGPGQYPAPIPVDGWIPYELGDDWGGYDVTQWFKARVQIPREMAGRTVAAILNPGWEALCYLNGAPAQGLDRNRSEVVLTTCAKGGEEFEIVVEASATPNQYDDNPIHQFTSAEIAERDELVWSFYWDLKVANDVVAVLPPDSQPRMRLQDLVDWAVKLIDLNNKDDVASFRANIADAQKRFRAKLKDFRRCPGDGKITYVGHSHIDTAWLWPLRETRRKCARTFSSALRYMDRYPQFVFSQGQPQLYEFIKENYPTIWEGIKQRVKEGRWEATGGGWVEQDSNVAGAEALVRQYLYGRRFFIKEFGVQPRLVWLPDAFGFPITLPQIIAKCQLTAFGTTKINWSQYNQFPYSHFLWRGLDGTEILAFMPPGSYNSNPTPANAVNDWRSVKQKDVVDELSITFGHGDGGGGVTIEMFENVLRMKDVTGLPECDFGTLEGYVERLHKSVDKEKLPVYNDELYLELHRACQTTQARTKRNNRKGELLFRDTEYLSSVAMLAGAEYPQQEIYEQWKPFLTNQFHDILPGSSVNEVYTQADKDYASILGKLSSLREQALATISRGIDTAGAGTPVVIYNTLGWDRDDVASVAVTGDARVGILDENGKPVVSQVVTERDGQKRLLFEVSGVPSMGHSVYRMVENPREQKSRLKVSESRLENDFFVIQLSKTGTLSRFYDKRNRREVLPKGARANELQLFDDRPFAHDAWDIDFDIDKNRWPMDDVVSAHVTETGPVRATVRIVKKTEKSTLTQDISIWRNIPRVDFVTSVEWWEKRRLLKAAFPVDVLSRTATYEVQFGAIERPTHFSTSYDRAKFEVPGHRWVDLSESGYGVSLLNDCKYGFDIHENVMRISLLRSAIRPDPKADEGHHEFTYSLYPHAGSWRDANTVHRAYELNVPLIARVVPPNKGAKQANESFVRVDRNSVVIDTVKKAEDSDAVIIRCYEAHGVRGPVTMSFASPPQQVSECDLMEENDVPVRISGSSFEFSIKPWEIRSFKVVF